MLSPQDVLPVLKVHHFIRALGNISKGFPDAPVPTPTGYIPPAWVAVFDQVAEAVMVSLSRMSQFKVVREAVSCCVHYPLTKHRSESRFYHRRGLLSPGLLLLLARRSQNTSLS